MFWSVSSHTRLVHLTRQVRVSGGCCYMHRSRSYLNLMIGDSVHNIMSAMDNFQTSVAVCKVLTNPCALQPSCGGPRSSDVIEATFATFLLEFDDRRFCSYSVAPCPRWTTSKPLLPCARCWTNPCALQPSCGGPRSSDLIEATFATFRTFIGKRCQ